MDSARDELLSRIHDPAAVFVFPSEVIASHWCEQSLRLSGLRAIRTDRFISWDTFKERTFRSHESRRPANRLHRSIFVQSFLARNRREPILESLVRPEFAENSAAFESFIRAALPGLGPLMDRGNALRTGDSADIFHDLEALFDAYRGFLDAHELFEPGWTVPGSPEVSRDYLIFFPEVLEDYPEYEPLLGPRSGGKGMHIIPSPVGRTTVELLEFANSTQETNDVLDSLELLLDAGVSPSKIVLTVCALPEYRPMLEREAALRQIPLSFRSGLTLAEYPPGRFLSGMGELVSRGFGVDAMKSYFLNGAVPWKSIDQNRNLVRFGLHWNIGPAWTEAGRERDPWKDALERARTGVRRRAPSDDGAEDPESATLLQQIEQLSTHYTALRVAVRRIVTAASFRTLRDALYAFYGQYLDTGSWDSRNLPVFQSCMEVLADLVEAEEDFASDIRAADLNPYRFWISTLGDRLYVPRGAAAPSTTPEPETENMPDARATGGDGIAVFPYRVSAGLEPGYHFIVGASQDATRVALSHYPYLREDQKERLSLSDRDLSVQFSALYEQSGERVYLSCSRETGSGAQLAAGYFVRTRRVLDAARGDLRARVSAALEGPDSATPPPVRAAAGQYSTERLFWAGGSPILFPDRLYPQQEAGFRYQLATGLSRRGRDFTREVVADPEALRTLLSAQESESHPGLLRMSAAHLEKYTECPFAYLVRYGLLVSEEPFDVDYAGAASTGSYYHDVVERLYRSIHRLTGTFNPESLDEYRAVLNRMIGDMADRPSVRTFPSHDGQVPVPGTVPLFPPLLEVFRADALKLLGLLLEADSIAERNNELAAAEDWYSCELPEPGVHLFGRIDRITRNTESGTFVLVDYKKKHTPTRTSIRKLLEIDPEGISPGAFGGTAIDDESEGSADVSVDRGVLQIPIYAALARAKDRPLQRAAYYSIEQARYFPVFDAEAAGAFLDETELNRLVELVLALAGTVAKRIRGGDYRLEQPENGCEACSLRTICRARYTVRGI